MGGGVHDAAVAGGLFIGGWVKVLQTEWWFGGDNNRGAAAADAGGGSCACGDSVGAASCGSNAEALKRKVNRNTNCSHHELFKNTMAAVVFTITNDIEPQAKQQQQLFVFIAGGGQFFIRTLLP